MTPCAERGSLIISIDDMLSMILEESRQRADSWSLVNGACCNVAVASPGWVFIQHLKTCPCGIHEPTLIRQSSTGPSPHEGEGLEIIIQTLYPL